MVHSHVSAATSVESISTVPPQDTTLLKAAEEGDDDAIQQAIDQDGAQLNTRSPDGFTPLHLAIQNTHASATSLLIRKGADLEATDNTGRTPLHLAAEIGFAEGVKLLLEARAPVQTVNLSPQLTPLHKAVEGGHVRVAELLLQNGANVDPQSPSGQTPLFTAVLAKNHEMIDFLLKNGADKTIKDQEGKTPVDLAEGSQDILKLFDSIVLLQGPATKPPAESVASESQQLDPGYPRPGPTGNMDKMIACWNMKALVVDFFIEETEQRIIAHPSVFNLLYGQGPKQIMDNARGANLPGKKPTMRWYHLPANNMEWVQELVVAHLTDDNPSLKRRIAFDFMSGLKLEMPKGNHVDSHTDPSYNPKPVCYSMKLYPIVSPDRPDVDAPVQVATFLPFLNYETWQGLYTMGRAVTPGPVQRPMPIPTNLQPRGKSVPINRPPGVTNWLRGVSNSPPFPGARSGPPPPPGPPQGVPGPAPPGPPILQPVSGGDLNQGPASNPLAPTGPPQPLQPQPPGPLPRQPPPQPRQPQQPQPPLPAPPPNPSGAPNFPPFRWNPNWHLIKGYYLTQRPGTIPPLQLRRTLDQYSLPHLNINDERIKDQVVTRYTANFAIPKLFVVDQLWLWIINENTVISCAPTSWHEFRAPVPLPEMIPGPPEAPASLYSYAYLQDPLSVPQSVLGHLRMTHRAPVTSARHLARLITQRCIELFDPHGAPPEFQFFEMFDRSIGVVSDKTLKQLQRFRQAALLPVSRTMPREELSIGTEIVLLAEIEDIRDELGILHTALLDQQRVNNSIDTLLGTQGDRRVLNSHLRETERMIKMADTTAQRLYSLLDLKQKQASILEALAAREQADIAVSHAAREADQAEQTRIQAEEAVKQGKTVVLFTVVTVIFLPLSFMAAFFTINIDSFPVNEKGNLELGYVLKIMVGVSAGLSIPFVFVIFNQDRVWRILGRAKELVLTIPYTFWIFLPVMAAAYAAIWTSRLAYGMKIALTILFTILGFLALVSIVILYLVDLAQRDVKAASSADSYYSAPPMALKDRLAVKVVDMYRYGLFGVRRRVRGTVTTITQSEES